MVRLMLSIKAELEGVTNLEPRKFTFAFFFQVCLRVTSIFVLANCEIRSIIADFLRYRSNVIAVTKSILKWSV